MVSITIAPATVLYVNLNDLCTDMRFALARISNVACIKLAKILIFPLHFHRLPRNRRACGIHDRMDFRATGRTSRGAEKFSSCENSVRVSSVKKKIFTSSYEQNHIYNIEWQQGIEIVTRLFEK